MNKKIIVSILICLVVMACLGCIGKEQLVTPPTDATPVTLLPKNVRGITLENTLPLYGSTVGAEDGVRGDYVDENKTKITVAVYKYKDTADAKKYVGSMRNDLLLKTKFRNLEEDEVIVFNEGYFLFVIWGNSSSSVEKLAKATGYY